MNLPIQFKNKKLTTIIGIIPIIVLLLFQPNLIARSWFLQFIYTALIVLGFTITNALSKNTKKGNLFVILRNLFGDFEFKSSIVIDFASWIYYFANVGFWTFIPYTLLFNTDIDIKLSTTGLALLFLVVLRCIIETTIALVRISENTSK